MKNVITIASLTLLLTACGGGPLSESGSSNGDSGPVAETPDTTPELEYTADLRSSAEFDFSTSRAIAIDFDVAQARTTPGLMSLCTKYTEVGGQYDIDYNSCTVQSPLVDGVYSGQMDVTNDVNSVIGVVWFKDPDFAPVYKEFMLEVGAKVARRGAGPQAIVWR